MNDHPVRDEFNAGGHDETNSGFSHFFWTNINLLTPNVDYSGRTAPLTSKVAFYVFIQQM